MISVTAANTNFKSLVWSDWIYCTLGKLANNYTIDAAKFCIQQNVLFLLEIPNKGIQLEIQLSRGNHISFTMPLLCLSQVRTCMFSERWSFVFSV